MSDDMIERVAKAIEKACDAAAQDEDEYCSAAMARAAARAAIEAMKLPAGASSVPGGMAIEMEDTGGHVSMIMTDEVQSWVDEPTVRLRWNKGVLEQMHWRRGFTCFGQEIKRLEEWRRVPDVASP